MSGLPPPSIRSPSDRDATVQESAAATDVAAAFDQALDSERDALRLLFPLPPPRSARAATHRRVVRAGSVAALVLTTATAALLWLDPAWHTETVASAVGEQRTVPLSDGSTLTLDTATTLEVRWHLRSRQVALRHGQARFDVAHSAWRPFEVAAAGTRIRVVGTLFDVRRTAAEVQVTVHRGRVAVTPPDATQAPQFLAPGQRLQVAHGSADTPEPVDLDAANAWATGQLDFDRTPLRDVLAEIQRYRMAPIHLRDDGRLGRLTITGRFDARHTDQLLDMLPGIVPVRVQHRADGSVHIAPL